jgi:hypothetical protein
LASQGKLQNAGLKRFSVQKAEIKRSSVCADDLFIVQTKPASRPGGKTAGLWNEFFVAENFLSFWLFRPRCPDMSMEFSPCSIMVSKYSFMVVLALAVVSTFEHRLSNFILYP